MIEQHAPLPPSGAHVWGHCAGAIQAALQIPSELKTHWSKESDEGTAAAWVAAEYLQIWQDPKSGAPVLNDWLGLQAPNRVIVDQDMLDSVEVYTDHVLQLCQQHGGLRDLKVEHRVHMPHIHQQNWGTLDSALWVPQSALLIVRDFKHGHRYVRAEGNLQLIDYAEGMVAELNLTGYDDQQITVDLGIVQPRCYHSPVGPISSWRVRLSDLRGYTNQLRRKAEEALGANPKMNTGPHCGDCPAVGRCTAAKMAGYALLQYSEQPFALDAMRPADLAVERDMLAPGIKAAAKRLEAIESELQYLIRSGQGADCGLTVQTTEKSLAWTAPTDAVRMLGQQFGVTVDKDAVITPTQFIKAVPRGLKEAAQQAVNAMATRQAGSLKLVRVDDSRTARAFKAAKE